MRAQGLRGRIRTESTLTFVCGLLAGALMVLVGRELWSPSDPDGLQHFAEVRDFARESFVREVSDQELLDDALKGMLSSLDPYSRYYDASQTQDLLRQTGGRYRGIGAVFRSPVEKGQVLYPLAGSPASEAGLRVGDQVLQLNGRDLQEFDAASFRTALGNPDPEGIRLQVRGLDGEERQLSVIPGSIVDPSVRHARMLDLERHIGYLAITRFTTETGDEFAQAMEFLAQRKMEALVLDLRHNLGGTLSSAVELARRFVHEGIIVSTEGRGEPILYEADPAGADLKGMPLVILVNASTASASEVLAGALQDHRMAALVGEATFGKGMVQAIRSFGESGGRAKVTTSYYYSPNHRNFERSADPNRDYGILPDLAVPLLAEERAPIRSFLESYSPGPDVLPALEAWAAESGQDLIPPMPVDPQLESALELLRGRYPGPSEQDK
ncbi:MAG: S41 family peptidase [bacterium]